MKITNLVPVKPYMKSELASIYGVSKYILKNWLRTFEDELGQKEGKYYSIAQVKLIFEKLGVPHVMEL